jgi:peptidoglycan/LPS O-acetylase OafA/YrhL
MQQSYWAPLPSGEPSPQPQDLYYPWFDWLRASLAILVMLGHDGLIPWIHSGAFAVQAFFALSGWLIGGILLKVQTVNLPRFFFNRAIRIWIPYYVALALLIAASLLKDRITWKWAEFFAYDMLMVWNLFATHQLADFRAAMPLQGTGNHFATVHAEEQFYLLCPLLLVLAPKWGRSMLLWSALAVCAWINSIYSPLMLGVLAAIVASRFEGFHLLPWVRWTLISIGMASALAVVVGMDYYMVAPLLAISVVLLLATKGTPTSIGKIAAGMSYPLYLNHWIGVFVANALLSPFGMRDSLLRQLIACAVSLALAIALYLYVDRQLLKRRSSWFTPERGRALTFFAYAMISVGILFGLYLSP